MRKVLLGLSALALMASANIASAAPWVPVKTLEYTINRLAPSPTRTVATVNDWRYRWHNGQWWYYLPSNSWVVWSGGRWTPWTGGNSAAYRGGGYYGGQYYGNNYYGNGYRDGYRYGYRSPYPYRGRAPYVTGYRGGVNAYGPGVGVRFGGRRW